VNKVYVSKSVYLYTSIYSLKVRHLLCRWKNSTSASDMFSARIVTKIQDLIKYLFISPNINIHLIYIKLFLRKIWIERLQIDILKEVYSVTIYVLLLNIIS